MLSLRLWLTVALASASSISAQNNTNAQSSAVATSRAANATTTQAGNSTATPTGNSTVTTVIGNSTQVQTITAIAQTCMTVATGPDDGYIAAAVGLAMDKRLLIGVGGTAMACLGGWALV
ncbi:hypothetical protein RQP46_000396 [Phenoliferia psychrophenolica]